MSKRSGFIYNGSKIEIVPFCGPPAKMPKLSTKIPPQQGPKVISNIHITPQNAEINQSQKYSNECEKIPKVSQEKELPSDLTYKKPSKVSQAVNKNNYIQKNFTKAEASRSSWASNYLSSIGDMYKKPIKLNLSTSKAKLNLPIQKVNTLRKDNKKKAINTNSNHSASQDAVCQANLKVLVNAEEAPIKPMKQCIHAISNPENIFITRNSNITKELTNSAQKSIGKHTTNYCSSLKATKPLSKSDSEKVPPSKKDRDKSSSKSYNHKSLSLKQSDKGKALEFVVNKKKDIEYTLTSTSFVNINKNIDTKPIASCFDKNISLFKNKHHISEEKSENKSKITNFKAKDKRCKSPERKGKFRDEILDKTPDKSRSKSKSKEETHSRQISKERISKSKVEHRSSCQGYKRSTSKCIETSSKDIHVDKYKSSSTTLLDCKKADNDDLVKPNIKSKVVKRKYSSRPLELLKQNDKEILCKSEHRKCAMSVLSSPVKIKTKKSSEQTKKNVRSSSTNKLKKIEQIKQSEITDLRQKLSHRSLNELFSKKRNRNIFLEKRDNLKITIPNSQEDKKTESDSDEQLKLSTNVKLSSSKSVKNKTIKLVINVKYEQPTTSNVKSSDSSGNEVDESNNFNNVDLSFLDDINIDEIVNSLKDCENNSELSKSGVEIIAGSTDESSLDSTLFLQSQEHINYNIPKSILENSNMCDGRLRSINESRNVVCQNKTLSLQLDGIKTEAIETENAGGFRKTLDSEIINSKIRDNTDHNAEESRIGQSQNKVSFAVRTQDGNSLVEKEIKTECPEIEYGNLSQEAIIDVNSIKEEVSDELQAKLAAITGQPVRRCTREGNKSTENDKKNYESNTMSMNSLFEIQTESDFNCTLDAEDISLIDQVNIKSTINKTKHKEENNNTEQGPCSNETRIISELVAGAAYVSSSNSSEVENTQTLGRHCNLKEKKQLENRDVSGTELINKELYSTSDLTHTTVIFTNLNDIKPQSPINKDTSKIETEIGSNFPKSDNLSKRGSRRTENINLLDEKKHRETGNNKSMASVKTEKISNGTTVEPSKVETNVKNQNNSLISISGKLNFCDPSYLQICTTQNSQKVSADGSGNQELKTALQFNVVNEMSRKLLTTDEENNKKNHCEDVKHSTDLKCEAESAIKDTSNETITKSIDAVKKDEENTPTIVKSQNEQCPNRNDVDSSKRCKVHSPIKSPKCDKSNANNTKKVAYLENEINATLQGVDKVRGRKLEQRMLEYLRDEYKVLSVINKGQYSIIYKCKDSLGRNYAAKVIKNQNKRLLFGIAKENMLKQCQKDIPRYKLNLVYLINGFMVQGRWCFLMEYYPKNLKQVLDEGNKPFNIDEVQNLSKQLISAVTVLRNNNIVHSDIKPTHIMLNSANNKLKLCGFDRAGPIDSQILLPSIGTVNYRAPEIILGHSAGYSIDVWSTALVMYEMATNIILFPGLYNNDILFKQICTLGSIPFDVINNSLYKEQHFINGVRFIRRLGEHGEAFKLKDQFYKSKRLECTIRRTYYKYWAASRLDKKENDLSKLYSFHKLLVEMLVMHPNYRIPIEFVHANPFINDFQANAEA